MIFYNFLQLAAVLISAKCLEFLVMEASDFSFALPGDASSS
jgi:hypothetical protein